MKTINTNYGINSKKKSTHFLKWKVFSPFKIIPNIIYATPNMTDNFIFKLF